MNSHRSRVRWLICGGLAGLLAGAAVQREPRPGSDPGSALDGATPCTVQSAPTRAFGTLDGVAGLERPVTFSETKIPLGELVEKVAAATGAPLVATREVADEPVAVIVTRYPARELLRQTAALLGFQWRKRGEGAYYEIGQDPAERRREEALRHSAIEEALRQFWIEVGRTVELASLSPEDLRSLPEQAQEQRLRSPHAARPGLDEEEEWRERRRVARSLDSPVAHFLGRFVGTLSAAHWRVLIEEGRPLIFSSRPAPGELRLPAPIAGDLASLQPRMFAPGTNLVAGSPEAEQRLRQRERDLQEEWAGATGYQVILEANARRLHQGTGRLRLSASVAPAKPGFQVPGSEFPEIPIRSRGGARWGTSLVIESGPAAPRLPVSGQSEMERDPVFATVKKADLAAPGTRFFDRLPLLARTYDVHFLSDAYDSAPRLPGSAVAGSEAATLSALLSRWAGSSHQWDRQGKLVRLRSRTWFFDRPREVPSRLLRRWQKLCDLHGALPLEEWVTSVAGLSDGQLELLADIAGELGLPPEFRTARLAVPALRLYASLSPEQRQALASGESIPTSAMGPRQRELFLTAAQVGGAPAGLPAAADGRDGSFSLTRAPFARIREGQGDAARYRLEPVARGPDRMAGYGESKPAALRPSSREPLVPSRERGELQASTSRHPVTQVTLHCRLRSGTTRSVPVITAERQTVGVSR